MSINSLTRSCKILEELLGELISIQVFDLLFHRELVLVGNKYFWFHFECSFQRVVTLKCFFLSCWLILNYALMELLLSLKIIFKVYHFQNQIFAVFLFQVNLVWNFHQNLRQGYILISRGYVSSFSMWFF